MGKLLFSWSGGKDSALALFELLSRQNLEIAALLTTVTESYDRISMHGVRRALLEEQSASLGLPLEKVFLPKNFSNEEYEARMRKTLEKYLEVGVKAVAFGDVFLEDLKREREEKLSKIGLKGVFPLWKRNTSQLAREFIDLGFNAVITCVDSNALGKEFVGREFDEQFLSQLPPEVDPCGERGEFHSFVYDGPLFNQPVPHKKGKTVLRNKHFYYCDFTPVQ